MTRLVILDPKLTLKAENKVVGVDISNFADPDYISVALPAFPGTKVTQASSYIEFTSHPDGDFDVGPVDSIGFSQSNPSLPTSDGDAEARFPVSLLTTVDLSNITGVRFGITVSANATVMVMAIRAISADWNFPPLDINTMYDWVQRPPSPTGAANTSPDFPTVSDTGMPTDFPIVFHADANPGARDPRPVDAHLSAFITSGSLIDADGTDVNKYNQVAWYFREIPIDEQIQLELDLMSQADLIALGHQPDFAPATFTTRRQDNIDDILQSDLDTDTQFDLDTLPDYTTHSWYEVKLRWSAIDTTLTIENADGVGYTFTPPVLDPISLLDFDQGKYIVLLDFETNQVRIRIFQSNQVGEFDASMIIFDSGIVHDDSLFKVRKGRLGWYAQMLDGNATLQNIRQRDMNFGELKSKSYASFTPVKGVQLSADASSPLHLATNIFQSPWGVGSINADPSASATGGAWRIQSEGGQPLQGIQTNWFVLDNFQNIDISFQLNYPQDALVIPGAGLDVFLYGEYGRCIPLEIGPILGGRWETYHARLKDDLVQTGTYALMMVQTMPEKDTIWWIENIKVETPAILWWARSQRDDAWHTLADQWVPFRDVMDRQYSGLTFDERGRDLQIKLRTLRQSAIFHNFTATPQYATLGNFAWTDGNSPSDIAPSATITSNVIGRTVIFVGEGSADADGFVIAYYWSFGDGTYEFSPRVRHTYATPGTYKAVLTVVDNLGNTDSATATVTVA